MKRTIMTLVLIAAIVLCMSAAALAAADPLPPVDSPLEQMSDAALEQMQNPVQPETDAGASSEEPSGEASSEEPELPLTPGRYESEDGSVLNVKKDGTCTYETLVSGTVNGNAMSGRLTFHGTVEGGKFSFDKVTFYGLDLTGIAASAGYTDASVWEEEAAAIYADALDQLEPEEQPEQPEEPEEPEPSERPE